MAIGLLGSYVVDHVGRKMLPPVMSKQFRDNRTIKLWRQHNPLHIRSTISLIFVKYMTSYYGYLKDTTACLGVYLIKHKNRDIKERDRLIFLASI